MLPDGTPGSVDVVGITWLGEDTASADDLLGTNEDRTLTAEAKEWLADPLSDGPLHKAQIAKEARRAGITAKPLRVARESLGVEIQRDHTTRGRPSIWSLPRLRAQEAQETHKSRNRAHQNRDFSDYVPSRLEGA